MVTGVGVATADPELRHVGENGTVVCTVNLAFNRNFRKKDDAEWQSEVCFLRAQVWGVRAEKMAELVKKGQPIYINGYLKQDTWEKDGQKRVSYTVNLRDFQLCVKNDKKKNELQPQAVTPQTTAPVESPIEDDDSIPF